MPDACSVCGKTTDINFQLQKGEFTLQTEFCLNPRGQIFTRAQPTKKYRKK